MLRDSHLTDGIGARTAHSILCRFTKDATRDQTATYVTSAKEKKTDKNAQPEELTLGHFRTCMFGSNSLETSSATLIRREAKGFSTIA